MRPETLHLLLLSLVLGCLLVMIAYVLRGTYQVRGPTGGPIMDARPMGQWVGWVRYGWKRWVPVVDHDDRLQCNLLLEHYYVCESEVDGEKLVMRAGEYPTGKPIHH